MDIVIRICIDGEAFTKYGGSEVADILRALATQCDECGLGYFSVAEVLHDGNGAACGIATIEGE